MSPDARLVALVALTSACSDPVRGFAPTDAGFVDAGARDVFTMIEPDTRLPCIPGMVYCQADTRYTCDARGEIVDRVPCVGSTPLCVQGRGCLACPPASLRCDPSMPQRTQSCRPDGSGYTTGEVCDPSQGRSCAGGVCVDRCSDSALGNSYIGCDYWPTVTPNAGLDPMFQFAVVLANPQTYPVRVDITGGSLDAPRNVTLLPGAIETVVLPWVIDLVQLNPNCLRFGMLCLGGNPAVSTLRRNGAYHVHANGPINAYQFNPLTFGRPGGYFSYTNDASLLLPQGVLTQRYTVVTWPNFPWQDGMYVFGGFVSVVAVAGETTTVTVRPTAAIRTGAGVPPIAAGQERSFTLAPGDVLQLVGERVGGDLTGTRITASQRVAVFVGHDCTYVPTDRAACDHLEEQLFPDETWGRSYLVSAFRDRGPTVPFVARVVSRTDGNRVTFDPPDVHAEQTLGAGQFIELTSTRHFVVRGTGPLLVAKFMVGQGPSLGGAGVGDPAMVLQVPTEQYRDQYHFTVPSTYVQNFVNVVVTAGDRVEMDGQPLRGSSENLAGYTVFTLPIEPGNHRVRSPMGRPVGLEVYGVAPYTSYAYPGGLDLRRITPG